jgi:hypothetical protein
VWGYWGQITGDETGNYRATCVLLGETTSPVIPAFAGRVRAATTPEDRVTCDIVLSFGGDAVPQGSLIAQGLVKKPNGMDGLFAAPSARLLAITGGTGLKYRAKQGQAAIGAGRTIVIILD